MKPSSQVLLKAFFNKYAPEKEEYFSRFFPEQLQKSLGTSSENLSLNPSYFLVENLFLKVHYSWFLPTLNSYEKDIPLFLAALPEEIGKNLQKTLGIKPLSSLTPRGALFLKHHLIHSLLGEKENLLPPEYISSSILSPLLGFSKKRLVRLIDYLSLYDLAYEIKHIVDTKLLKQINQCLKDPLKAFLQKLLPQTEGERIPLQNWDGSKRSFYVLLHRKGLKKLALLLNKEQEALIWYVAHTLDIGRGSSLLKLCEKKVTANLAPAIMRGLQELLEKISHEEI